MDGRSRDQQESFELHEIATREDNDPDPSPSISTDEYRVEARRTPTITRAERDGNGNQNQKPGLWRRTKKSWTHSVALCVPQKSNRDHFGEFAFREVSALAEGDWILSNSLKPWRGLSLAMFEPLSCSQCKGLLSHSSFVSNADRLTHHPDSVSTASVSPSLACITQSPCWSHFSELAASGDSRMP